MDIVNFIYRNGIRVVRIFNENKKEIYKKG